MSIELQLKDKQEYERLKEHALYYSDRTMVVELPDECSILVDDSSDYDQLDDRCFLDYNGKKWTIDNISDNTRFYLGDMYGGKPEYKFETIINFPNLVEQGILVPSDNVKNIFSKFKKFPVVSDLECSNHKFKINGKWVNLDGVLDSELDYIFDNMLENNKNIFTTPGEVINTVKLKDGKGKDHFDISFQIIYDGSPRTLNTKLYYLPRILNAKSPLNALFYNGNNLNLLVNSKQNNKGSNELSFSGVAPEGYMQDEEIMYSPNKEVKKELGKIPVSLYRIMYAEYRLRNILKEM